MASKRLGLTVTMQEQTQWCWAAVVSAVAGFYSGTAISQCKIVDGQFATTTCCQDGSTAWCNNGCWTADALDRLGHLGSATNSRASLADVRSEIDAGRPVVVAVDWKDGGSHVLLAVAYADSDLTIADPSFDYEEEFDYSELAGLYRKRGLWARTYYTRP
jgi:hypothetical protein